MTHEARLFRILEITTIGLPFCAFKLLTGAVLARSHAWAVAGDALLVLGAADLFLNGINLALALALHASPWPACVAQFGIARIHPERESWRQLGLSVDAMLSFALVAVVIGLGLLRRMTRAELGLWNVSVVFNVLGAGFGRLAENLLRLHRDHSRDANDPAQ